MAPLQRGSCLHSAVTDVPFLLSLSHRSDAHVRCKEAVHCIELMPRLTGWIFSGVFMLKNKVENKGAIALELAELTVGVQF